MAGHSHISVDGTLIETDRCRALGPTAGVDLWWSGKHANHGGNIQVITAPDGWPLWTSDVRPGREHDTSVERAELARLRLENAELRRTNEILNLATGFSPRSSVRPGDGREVRGHVQG